MLHYEANELKQARQQLEIGLQLAQKLGPTNLFMFSAGMMAPTLYALGDTEGALQALREARHFDSQEALGDTSYLGAWEVNIQLRQGNLPFALDWAERENLSINDTPQYLRMEQQLTYARLLLAQGRPSEARRWLSRLERFTHDRSLNRWLITIHLLQAQAAARAGNKATAVDLVERALEIAAPGGYIRAFLDEDPLTLELADKARQTSPTFVVRVLDAAGILQDKVQKSTQPLIDPLSDRELEVLRLVAAGLSNREIAEELVIAIGTVKRHINHIYRKLSVHTRTQAVAKAREYKLLH
jgi:LuxR family maltose regulon positive regulatory protein